MIGRTVQTVQDTTGGLINNTLNVIHGVQDTTGRVVGGTIQAAQETVHNIVGGGKKDTPVSATSSQDTSSKSLKTKVIKKGSGPDVESKDLRVDADIVSKTDLTDKNAVKKVVKVTEKTTVKIEKLE
jgi:hypothetical protein